MDRVRALVEKLNTQLALNEAKANLIVTAQQLLTELGGAVSAKPLPQNIYDGSVSHTPEMPALVADRVSDKAPDIQIEERALPIMDNPASAIPDPLVAPTSPAIIDQNISAPTQPLQNEALINFNEKIEQKEVKDHLILESIKDLRSAIGINDKFQFIQELFGGDEKSFEVAIKTINAFKIFPEAQFYIKRELREKNNWDEENVVVKQFDQLVKRRFS
jgi:hypothetical protein